MVSVENGLQVQIDVVLWLVNNYYLLKNLSYIDFLSTTIYFGTGKSACAFYKSCVECQTDPECGWCDDGSGTGLGACLPGGNTNSQFCLRENWYFTCCPCNYIFIDCIFN